MLNLIQHLSIDLETSSGDKILVFLNCYTLLMRLGVHVSIGKGLVSAVDKANRLGCESMQIFSSNPNSWRVAPLDPQSAQAFAEGTRQSGIYPITLHMPYVLNLASKKDHIWKLSTTSLAIALIRADTLGAGYIIAHIGSHGGEGFEHGANRVAAAVGEAIEQAQGSAMVLLEAGSGGGDSIGSTFEELASILGRLEGYRNRVGVCLDTAHLWGAGYDISTADKVNAVLHHFDQLIGFDRLHVFHLNDTQKALGSKRDRHWHIGHGNIGLEGFRAIVNHPALTNVGGILETPEMESGKDIINLDTLKQLRVASSN